MPPPVQLRPMAGGLKTALRRVRQQRIQARSLTTSIFEYRPPPVSTQTLRRATNPQKKIKPKIKVPPPRVGIRQTCAEPLKAFVAGELATLDPRGARGRLIGRDNADRLRVGDVAMVRFRSGDPFSGVVMDVRRRGTDSGILLRNQLTRVGTEMWVKLYSPTVAGVEVVQRSQRRMRRARAYYFRKPKHDRGSLASLVDNHLRQSRILGRGGEKGKK